MVIHLKFLFCKTCFGNNSFLYLLSSSCFESDFTFITYFSYHGCKTNHHFAFRYVGQQFRQVIQQGELCVPWGLS